MTKHTANYNLPYPEGEDRVAVHSDVEALATKADAEMSQVIAKVDEKVTDQLSGMARKLVGKNLVNPDEIVDGHYIHSDGRLFELASFETTGFIPVESGVSYTSSRTRGYAFYDLDKDFISGSREQVSPSRSYTMVAPADGFLRVYDNNYEPYWQVEEGSRATEFQHYRVELEKITIPAAYIEYGDDPTKPKGQQFSRNGDVLTSQTTLGDEILRIQASLQGGSGGVFDWGHITLGGLVISSSADDVAPVVTQQGTIGANHGFSNVFIWEAGTHDKEVADLGSLWTNGTHEYALLQIRDDGALLAARKYVTNSDSTTSSPIVEPEYLDHVSGATNTETLDTPSSRGQMWPAFQRLNQRVTVDGVELTDGEVSGVEMRVQESYDILDFSSLYDQITSNVGVPYEQLQVAGAMRLESEWRIQPHGKITGEFHLTELQPTRLDRWAGIHAGASSGATTRWLPGVKPINGLDWSAGVPRANLTESQHVTTDDLHNPSQPPSVLIDVAPTFAVAVGVDPWYEAGQGFERIESVPNALWFLHTTQKIYPRVTGNKAPGWGRISIRGIRHYLATDEADRALSYPTDTLMAWSALKVLAEL